MSSRATGSAQHLFVSYSGVAMSRWLEAFPKAMLARPTELRKRSAMVSRAGLVWLHLDPDLPCLEQLTTLRKKIGALRLVVLASVPDTEDALQLFSAGARGYCNAHATAANLKQVANVVLADGLWIGETLMKRLVVATTGALSHIAASTPPPRAQLDLQSLTAREQQVALAVAGGASNKEVARTLNITERTIKAHVSAVFTKLGARDRLHLSLIMNGHLPG